MKKIFVVYNPVSGARKFRNVEKIIRARLEKLCCVYDWYETKKGDNDFPALKAGGYDLVLACGGDGTVSMVATYLFKNKLDIPFGIVGIGSTNLLAFSFFIPVIDVGDAVEFAVTGEAKKVDIGIVNGEKVMLIGAGKGYDNVFMRGAPRELKRKIGFFAYVWSFLTTYLAHPRCEYRVTVDGVVHHVVAKVVFVFNYLRFSSEKWGVGFKPDDGLLEVVVVNPSSFWDLFKMLVFFVMRRKTKKHPKVKFFEGKHIVIHSERERGYQVDGEVFDGGDLEVKVIEKGLSYSTSSK
ncbi:MAG: diacylglycerol kinase family protein [Candidatus Gracilibacteria bacterium]|jgi:diacylglycerol kinase (ATP)